MGAFRQGSPVLAARDRREDRNGRAITLQWTNSTSHDIAAVTDSQGRVTTVTHDGNGQISQIVDSAGRTYTYTYGTAGGWGKTLRSCTCCPLRGHGRPGA